MKTISTLMLLTVLGTGAWLHAQDQTTTNAPAPGAAPPAAPAVVPPAPAPADAPATPALSNATNALSGAELSPTASGETNATSMPPEVATTNAPSPTVILPNGEVGLRMNFRGVPLEMVLNYLSDAAGFIIVLDAQVRGKVDMWSNTPLTKDEAVNLLNTVLNKNGYAAIRNGRTITVVNRDEAKTKGIPVRQGSDPDNIPSNDEIVTQIIPVRTVEATALIKDLQPLVSTTTTITANEAGNSIIITDTQSNIRRVAEIIKAVDISADEETLVKVFHLKFADPTEMATLLSGIFPDETRSNNSQASSRFSGFRSMFGGRGGGSPFGGGDTGSSGGASQRLKKRARVIAVADPRTSSVIVTAGKDLMDQIAGMVEQLDSSPAKKQKVYVYSLDNADATEVEQVLSDMFERNSTSQNRNRSSTTRNNALQNRTTQNQQSSRTGNSSAFGSSGGRSSGGGF